MKICRLISTILITASFLGISAIPGMACTNLIVTPGASAGGDTLITYSCDAHQFYGELYFFPARVNPSGTMRQIYEWDSGRHIGEIPEAPRTWRVVGNINEHQLSIGETTFGGRKELVNPKGLIDYGSLMYIALQRAASAREAVRVMVSLANRHGYCSSGESFTIADPREVWVLEMTGRGPGETGILWVARRIPDGMVSAHANYARIGQFPLKDPENCLYAEDLIAFCRKKGYFEGQDREFNFRRAVAPLDFGALRFCEARVWRFFNLVRSSRPFPESMITGDTGADPLPLYVEPDDKVTLADMFRYMRDHFEGTSLDLSRGVGAGPFGLPYRWRPLVWKHGGTSYFHERAIATQQTGFSFVAQLRSRFPGKIGGVLWFGVDDAASTVYLPVYGGITRAPREFGTQSGSIDRFSWDSAFWVFNFVANYAYGRYSDMIQDIREVQSRFEARFMEEQKHIDQAALALYRKSPRLAEDFLTEYCQEESTRLIRSWRKLGQSLIVKYLDGNRRNARGRVTHPGYPGEWYRRISEEEGSRIRMPVKEKKVP